MPPARLLTGQAEAAGERTRSILRGCGCALWVVAVWTHTLVGRDVRAGVWVLCLQAMGSCAACVVSYSLAWLAAMVFG